VEFEWDSVKAGRNVEKHGVDFATAAEIFDDPDLLVVIDPRSYGERRYQAIGAVGGVTVRCIHNARRRRSPDHQRQEGEPS
jgi:uncharacterized protein